MRLTRFIEGPLGLPTGMLLAGLLPRQAALRLAEALADREAANADSPVAQAVRANQAGLRGLPYADPALQVALREVLRRAGRGYVDLFRLIARGKPALRRACSLDESLTEGMRRAAEGGHGVILVGPHLSNFDLLLMTLADHGFDVQALTYANQTPTYRLQNRLRRRFGLKATPVSFQSLRQAVARLRAGGAVLTGIDRPDPAGESLSFLGRQARLPVGHARLALRSGAAILAGAVMPSGDGRYRVMAAGLIEPKRGEGNEPRRAVRLAQQALALIEPLVRARPEEWLMFFPLWPELIPGRPAG